MLLPPRQSWARALFSAFAVFASVSLTGFALAQSAQEYDLKAAFLLNFADYVEWPPEAGLAADAPVRICLVGDDPFGDRIDHLLKARPASKRPLILHRMELASAALNCHIAFIHRSTPDALRQDLHVLADSVVLTVGQGPQFEKAGGIISLGMREGRVQLFINLAQAQRHQLTISSRLLSLAEVKQ